MSYKIKKGQIIFALVTLIGIFLASCASGARLYKWVDDKGVIHFSDRKPESKEKVEGFVEEREVADPPSVKESEGSEPLFAARSPIEYAMNCTFTIKGSNRLGTGFFVSPYGYAITCRHVIEGDSGQVALLNDQTKFPITVISISRRHDLALIFVTGSSTKPYLSIRDSGTLIPGERLFAIGASAGLQATITDGVFTGFRRLKNTKDQVIQFSAPVNQGNSGGPLVDKKGRAVGMVSMKFLKRKNIFVSGVGFGVLSSHVREEYGGYLP